MRLIMVIYSGRDPRLVPALLDAHRVGGWTELSRAHGAGSTGRREGSRAWPGDAEVYFSIVPAERVDELGAALRDEAARLPDGERLHVAVLPIETFF
ncbi:MAG: hypothetical protein IRZ00_12370 [Gemmatimonadetes bacterium]|nr:hypothetical protein [Gemmatimonadota bacterium]